MSRVMVLVAAVAISGVYAGVALGGTVNTSSGTPAFTASSGEANVLSVSGNGASIDFTDTGAALTAGAGCTQITPNQASCTSSSAQVDVDLGDQGDSVTVTGVRCRCSGGDGADTVVGGDGADTLRGNGDADTLRGGGGDDWLDGGRGDDLLFGGAGADAMNGDEGNDTVSYGDHAAGVTVTVDDIANDGNSTDGMHDNVRSNIESVVGTDAADTINGSGLDNSLYGRGGADTMRGAGGADLLDGGNGPDRLEGGAGIDTASYAGRTAGVTVTIDGVANDGNAHDGPAAARDNVIGDVENLTGGKGSDALTGNGQANALTGGGGDDVLSGGAAADLLDGGPGADAMNGGPDKDTVTYAQRTENLNVSLDGVANDGGASDAAQHDNAGADVENILGGSGNDTLTGSEAQNSLVGGAGNDSLSGLAREDTLDGGLGNDTLSGGDHADMLNGGDGNDLLQGDRNADTLNGGDGDDTLDGGSENDMLNGGAGNDTLQGGNYNDQLDGGSGDDFVIGEQGADDVSGGDGFDTAIYTSSCFPSFFGRPINATMDDQSGDGSDCWDSGDDGCDICSPGDNIHSNVEKLIDAAGESPDTFIGNDLANVLVGGSGADTLRSLGGDDTIMADDGEADTEINCGAGTDTAVVDALDPAPIDCESVLVATVPGAPALTGATPGNGSVTLHWSPPSSDGGASITST